MKRLRTNLLAGLVQILRLVAKHRPKIIVGVQQAGVAILMVGLPLLLEMACRLRPVPPEEIAEFRRGWAGVHALLSVNPAVSAT